MYVPHTLKLELQGRGRLPVVEGQLGAATGAHDDVAYLRVTHRLGRTGGELQRISTPGGSGVFTAICVWRARAGVRIFVGDDAGTCSYGLAGGRLKVRWRGGSAGTSPVLAGGLLYVYDPNGGLDVRNPSTGKLITRLPADGGHWNSPIVTDGRIALPEGDANEHRTTGVLDIYRPG